MSKKFTEEQYQKIVEIGDGYNEPFIENLADYISGTGRFDDDDIYLSQAIAIANPLTREWAHDKFVEKEKKYYWMSKTLDNAGAHYQLYRTRDNMIIAIVVPAKSKTYYEKDIAYAIAESEVKLWGFNPEMFDKEEA